MPDARRGEAHALDVQPVEQRLQDALQVEEVHRLVISPLPGGQQARPGHGDRHPLVFLRQVAIFVSGEHRADLEQGQARAQARVALDHFQQAGEQVAPQHMPVTGDRVGDAHVQLRLGHGAVRQQARLPLRGGHAVGDHLLQAQVDQQVADALFALQLRVAALRRQLVRHARLGDALVAVDTGDLLQQVGHASHGAADHPNADVQAVVRRAGPHPPPVDLDLELQPPQQLGDLGRRELDPQPAAHIRRVDLDQRVDRRQRVIVHQPLADNTARPPSHQLQAAPHAPRRHSRVHAAREAVGRLGRQALALTVRRTLMKFQAAPSSRMLRVFSLTSDSAPPITPAMESAPALSQTSTLKSSRGRSTPSRVVRRSPGCALRVRMVGG
jgi:hypothetical protein